MPTKQAVDCEVGNRQKKNLHFGTWRQIICLRIGAGCADFAPNEITQLNGSTALLFKRILNDKKAPPDPENKRKAPRYAVRAAFPFKAVLTLQAHDEEGNLIEDSARTPAWGGRVTNLSETGANIHPPRCSHRAIGRDLYL